MYIFECSYLNETYYFKIYADSLLGAVSKFKVSYPGYIVLNVFSLCYSFCKDFLEV